MNVYDFDKTIYRGDSERDFYFYALRKHPGLLRFLPGQLAAFFQHYMLHRIDKTAMKQRFAAYLAGVDGAALLPGFWQNHRKKIYPWYRKAHRADDLVISASPRFLLEPICRNLGIKHLIASEVDIRSGHYEGLNCHGEEKLRRYHEVWGDAPIRHFFSDSRSDTPLAQAAEKAHLIRRGRVLPWHNVRK